MPVASGAVPGAAARPVSQSCAAPALQATAPLDTLVPVPASPVGGGNQAPSADEPSLPCRRLPPVGATGRLLRIAPRTYLVQPGDTLNSIAERLYGDGARETALLEANRNLLPRPADLRAGMVLVVPADR